jgi:hypothetical protein
MRVARQSDDNLLRSAGRRRFPVKRHYNSQKVSTVILFNARSSPLLESFEARYFKVKLALRVRARRALIVGFHLPHLSTSTPLLSGEQAGTSQRGGGEKRTGGGIPAMSSG